MIDELTTVKTMFWVCSVQRRPRRHVNIVDLDESVWVDIRPVRDDLGLLLRVQYRVDLVDLCQNDQNVFSKEKKKGRVWLGDLMPSHAEPNDQTKNQIGAVVQEHARQQNVDHRIVGFEAPADVTSVVCRFGVSYCFFFWQMAFERHYIGIDMFIGWETIVVVDMQEDELHQTQAQYQQMWMQEVLGQVDDVQT